MSFDIFSFIDERYFSIVSLLCFLAYLVIQIVSFVRTGHLNKNLELLSMLKRNDVVNPETQTFSNVKKVLKYDKRTGSLYTPGEIIDLQELMDSHKSSCFDASLESYLPAEAPEPEFSYNGKHYRASDFLDDVNALADLKDDIVEKYSLDKDISLSKLADFLNEASFSALQVIENNKKEDLVNGESKAQETVEKVQPSAVPSHGESNTSS
ncbi:hypothetical protein [Sigmofec virus UA08Rod_6641]|uniref:Uncharacterized protein n=1 Tax=Sigmofec virus UA08Rod_6641 TaxID=2929236 RepID=A0A976N0B6_9VIRU|nr:hypothetical protein [Sigmofec virus UA08Rod_6641]